ncbi:DUF6527 family protein [Kamptonema sp. UHCC 0994]|uniref:DUF6527 family protein n=1 Tax=Kamptonema sp. UHCC 0994 TaxID=3031329 RepID=UPI0023B8DB84|nr:DUF6527 family protein [Kamptonema sp. UHCC 0994]MDF0554909.1 DUF6527 family protein [Kamptonema sp. UHCC 0994]
MIKARWRDDDNPVPGALKPVYNSSDHTLAGYRYTCVGCGGDSFLPVYDKSTGKGWEVVGDPEAVESLNIRPSIWHKDGCGWHGWLVNGEFISV